jgi:hypothetical protein
MALVLASLLIFTCNDAFAWGSVRTNQMKGLEKIVAPSHDYILNESYKNLEKDPAYDKISFLVSMI